MATKATQRKVLAVLAGGLVLGVGTAVTLAVTLMLPERMPVSADSARALTAPPSDMLLMS